MYSFLLLLCCVAQCIMGMLNPLENPNYFEGDIILNPEQLEDLNNGNYGYGSRSTDLWDNGVIPYTMDRAIERQPKAVAAINAAIDDYHRYTCLRFHKRRFEKQYINFFYKKDYGCSSAVGRNQYGANDVSLDKGCWSKGTALHEIAHSLGFFHEQSRPDRDNYVSIQWQNIIDGRDNHNFKKQSTGGRRPVDSKGFPYDYQSMMHYNPWAFSRNSANPTVTIKTHDSSKQWQLGQGEGMSPIDQAQINAVYNCKGNYPRVPDPTPQTPECHDAAGGCAKLKSDGDCTASIWQSWVSRKCRATCKICKGTGGGRPNPPIPTGSGKCVNRVIDCANQGFDKCTKPGEWGEYMSRSCRKYCGFC